MHLSRADALNMSHAHYCQYLTSKCAFPTTTPMKREARMPHVTEEQKIVVGVRARVTVPPQIKKLPSSVKLVVKESGAFFFPYRRKIATISLPQSKCWTMMPRNVLQCTTAVQNVCIDVPWLKKKIDKKKYRLKVYCKRSSKVQYKTTFDLQHLLQTEKNHGNNIVLFDLEYPNLNSLKSQTGSYIEPPQLLPQSDSCKTIVLKNDNRICKNNNYGDGAKDIIKITENNIMVFLNWMKEVLRLVEICVKSRDLYVAKSTKIIQDSMVNLFTHQENKLDYIPKSRKMICCFSVSSQNQEFKFDFKPHCHTFLDLVKDEPVMKSYNITQVDLLQNHNLPNNAESITQFYQEDNVPANPNPQNSKEKETPENSTEELIKVTPEVESDQISDKNSIQDCGRQDNVNKTKDESKSQHQNALTKTKESASEERKSQQNNKNKIQTKQKLKKKSITIEEDDESDEDPDIENDDDYDLMLHPRGTIFTFQSNAVNPPATLIMGSDKHENDHLISQATDQVVFFHVNDLPSAHVYLQLENGNLCDVPRVLLQDAAQLCKANSTQGNKLANVVVIYTLGSNLCKDRHMKAGEVGFHNSKQVHKILVPKRDEKIINRLNSTKRKVVSAKAEREREKKIQERRKQRTMMKLEQRRKQQRQQEKEKEPTIDLDEAEWGTRCHQPPPDMSIAGKPNKRRKNKKKKQLDSDSDSDSELQQCEDPKDNGSIITCSFPVGEDQRKVLQNCRAVVEKRYNVRVNPPRKNDCTDGGQIGTVTGQAADVADALAELKKVFHQDAHPPPLNNNNKGKKKGNQNNKNKEKKDNNAHQHQNNNKGKKGGSQENNNKNKGQKDNKQNKKENKH